MKVYLIKDCECGKNGSLKEVSDGFARNFLIPNKFAITYKGNELFINNLLKKENVEKVKKDKKETALSIQIENEVLTFNMDSVDGKLYGSVDAEDIAAKLRENKLAINKSQVLLDKPLKKVGTHVVTIKLSSSLLPTIKIKIVEIKKDKNIEIKKDKDVEIKAEVKKVEIKKDKKDKK